MEPGDQATPLELDRLAVLHGLHVLDTDEEEAFDTITALAAERFEVPISLISFVDENRQWFKSHHGLDVRETPRTVSFCAHAIERAGTFVVPDTHEDPRFAANPLVTGPPHMRFYAGHPLTGPGGYRVGTFNIIDRVPRTFGAADRRLLEGFARWAECEIAVREIEEARQATDGARQAASRSDRAKSEFLSRVSHELRTPLNAILGFSTLLAMDNLTEPQQESVAQVQAAGRHLLALVEELLDLARIEQNRLDLTLEAVPVGELVDSALGLARPLADARAIDLVRADDPATGRRVRADRQRTLQILLNLLSNAVKYNRDHGVVTVAVEERGPQVAIAVRDTGPGLDADDVARLFEPFVRLGAERTDVEGAGVGLSISRQLAEAMAGTIEVSSTPGHGSTFTIVLPASG